MSGAMIGGILILIWAIAVLIIALLKPPIIWGMGKIQGFVKLMGDKGTTIFFIIIGLIAGAVGIYLIM